MRGDFIKTYIKTNKIIRGHDRIDVKMFLQMGEYQTRGHICKIRLVIYLKRR